MVASQERTHHPRRCGAHASGMNPDHETSKAQELVGTRFTSRQPPFSRSNSGCRSSGIARVVFRLLIVDGVWLSFPQIEDFKVLVVAQTWVVPVKMLPQDVVVTQPPEGRPSEHQVACTFSSKALTLSNGCLAI